MSVAHSIETSPEGTVVFAIAVIAAFFRSLPSPAVTLTVPPEVSAPVVPVPHVMSLEPLSPPHEAIAASESTADMHDKRIPVMWAGSVHTRPGNSSTNRQRVGSGQKLPRERRSVPSTY